MRRKGSSSTYYRYVDFKLYDKWLILTYIPIHCFPNLSTSVEAFWRTQCLLFCGIINVDVTKKTFTICCGGHNELLNSASMVFVAQKVA